jgi:alginate export protein
MHANDSVGLRIGVTVLLLACSVPVSAGGPGQSSTADGWGASAAVPTQRGWPAVDQSSKPSAPLQKKDKAPPNTTRDTAGWGRARQTEKPGLEHRPAATVQKRRASVRIATEKVEPRRRVELAWPEQLAPASGRGTTRAPLQWGLLTNETVSVTPPSAATSPVAIASQPAPLTLPAVNVEAPKPTPIGLQRSSDDWPKWVKVGVQYRGRVEGTDGLAAVKGRDDSYYLNRFRLDSTVIVRPWLRVVGQVQDARTLGYNITTQPTSMTDTFDLRQAYVDVQSQSRSGFSLRVGRQELTYGEQRLIGNAEWNNTARTFDAVRATAFTSRGKIDFFAASVVKVEQGGFDDHKTDERLFGAAATIAAAAIKGTVEPYLFVKDSDAVVGELGGTGRGRLYATGARIVGALPHRGDFGAEVVVERGDVAGDAIAAWALHYNVGWRVSVSPIKPRLFVELNQASGDGNPTDGRRGTFDQLYPTNHGKYGMVDQMGWRNMRDVAAGFEIQPTPKWKVASTVHRLFLATTADGLYNAAGVRTVFNPKATSTDVGTELGLSTTYTISKELSIGAGLGHLVPGEFLGQSTTTTPLWAPYLMWNVKF